MYTMRRIFAFLLCLALASVLKAQDIAGVWVQVNSASDGGSEMTVSDTLKLSADGVFRDVVIIGMSMDEGDRENTTIRMQVLCSGKWTCENAVLTQTYDIKSVSSKVLEQPEGFPKMFANMITKATVSEFKKQAKKPQRSEVLSVTADTLKLKGIGEKSPEIDTYVRVE